MGFTRVINRLSTIVTSVIYYISCALSPWYRC